MRYPEITSEQPSALSTETAQIASGRSASLTANLFIEAACNLGEGPFWFEGRLWWVDIEDGLLCSANENGKNLDRNRLGQKLGAAAPIGNDRFIVALEKRIALFDRTTKNIVPLATIDSEVPGVNFNDGKCDPWGRFLAGTLSDSDTEPACALYSYEAGLGLRKLRDNVILSNGLAWDSQGTTLYFIDSMRREVAAFPYAPDTGLLGEKRLVINIPEEQGIPDGMAIDSDGNLWIALWGGSSVGCWSPESGQALREISLPCSLPTSCCFGGKDFRRLYITTARNGLSPSELKSQPLAGSIFFCDLDTPGYPATLFKETHTNL